jgi:serine protease inhibitor
MGPIYCFDSEIAQEPNPNIQLEMLNDKLNEQGFSLNPNYVEESRLFYESDYKNIRVDLPVDESRGNYLYMECNYE